MNASVICLITLALVSPFVIFAIYSRRETWARTLSVLMMVVIIGPVVAEHLAALGNPLPTKLADLMPWRKPGHYQVLGSKVVIGDSIYVLLDNGSDQPIYLSMPFDKDLADELQRAIDSGGATFDGGTVGPQGAPTWNTKPQFLPVPPPPPLPPKLMTPEPPPVVLDRKST